ncbi:MAG: beta-N-acetylhexosaminidase [archaeon]|nr:beta-N-acetylhexosaminidase [archaeon]
MSKLIISVLFSLIAFSLEGNGLNVQNQLILMPYPQEATFNYNSTDAIQLESSLKLALNSDTCTGDCKTFLTDAFKEIITDQITKKEKVTDFRVSLHEPIDLPRHSYKILSTIEAVSLTFKEDSLEKIFPKLEIGIDESYTIEVGNSNIRINAVTVFGARHAFHTLNQLIRINDETKKCIIFDLPIKITDYPRFKWRGLMIDPARNPLKLSYYKRIVDALSFFKANVLHIHLADAQNFIFESKKHPELSQYGIFDQSKVLTQDFIKELIAYGKKKGVLIYGGINFPAHVASIGLSNPKAVCDIWDYILDNEISDGENYIALNPANSSTFNLIYDIIDEISTTFESNYIHVGGEPVHNEAWTQATNWDEIMQFMADHKLEDTTDLEKYINTRTQTQVQNRGKIPIVYQEVFENYGARQGAIVHVWTNKAQIKNAVENGFNVVISEGFDLDKQQPYCHDYDKSKCVNIYMYVWNNRKFLDALSIMELTADIEKGVLGGEGNAWGESVDEQNFFEVVFQRYGAIAERFWSPKTITDPDSHEVRANYARCVGLRMGILKGTGPLYHGICTKENEHQ